MNSNKTILLTIDVEDWFQVENFKPWIPFETWDQRELRVEKNTHQLLNLFDSIELKAQSSKLKEPNDSTGSKTLINPDNETNQSDIEDFRRRRIGSEHFHPESDPDKNKSQKSCLSRRSFSAKAGKSCQTNNYKIESIPRSNYELSAMSYEKSHPKVTFFILGWLAERLPNLVREIHSRGHEIASHGYNHNLCYEQSAADLKKELNGSKKILEDITGLKVFGFRAPNFSINDEILKIIEDCGFLYDSSYNSFGLHGRYGQISLNRDSKQGIAHKISEHFFELPISNLNISYELSAMSPKRNDRRRFLLPWGGGAYFRLMPLPVFMTGLKNILKKENAYLFYFHPWEFDSEQPKVDNACHLSKFKHYTNIRQTEKKLKKLIKNLSHCQFITCSQYLEQNS